jgi:ATP-dependent DNA helicase RecG
MTKNWLTRAFGLLDSSLKPIPQELNEIDWKEDLSPKADKLAQHISAFANQPGGGMMVFGIENNHATVIGVTQKQAEDIVGRLSSICRDSLDPLVTMDHAIELYQNKPLLFVYIRESSVKPVHIKSKTIEDAFIRSGGTTRKASRQELGGLMLNSKTPQYEELNASKLLPSIEVLTLIDFKSIFNLLGKPVPRNAEETLSVMQNEKLIKEVDGAGYYITNFGALAGANNLSEFDDLTRKRIRVIRYKGLNKVETLKEFPGSKGYAIGFEGLIDFVTQLLPSSEIIKSAFRTEITVYPEIAIRELFANALIHQDFTIKGTGPIIEIFDDRISITNPGKLLPSKKLERLIGTTPESRNELLASSFRRFGICEERGSGFTKTISAIEFYGLPPLKLEEFDNSFRATIYAPKAFGILTEKERVEACYQHSIIRYLSSGSMNNASLRERFKMSERQRPQISLVIKQALNEGRIKAKDPENTSTKYVEYIPYWG